MFRRLLLLIVLGLSLTTPGLSLADWPWENHHHAEDEANDVMTVVVWNNFGQDPPGLVINVTGMPYPIYGFPWRMQTFTFPRGGVFHITWPNPNGNGAKTLDLGLSHNVYIDWVGTTPNGLRMYDVRFK